MSAMPIERAILPRPGPQQTLAVQGGFPLAVQGATAHICLSNNRNVHLSLCDVSDGTSEVKAMRAILVRTSLLAMVVFTGAGSALGQTNEDLKARCDQLVAYYDYYNVSRSENSDGRRNHTRIGAEIDCGRGNYEVGIKAMEGLLIAKNFTVPESNVASTPDGRVRPIDTARLPAVRTEQPQ